MIGDRRRCARGRRPQARSTATTTAGTTATTTTGAAASAATTAGTTATPRTTVETTTGTIATTTTATTTDQLLPDARRGWAGPASNGPTSVGDRLTDHRLEPLGRGPRRIGQVDLVMLAAPPEPLAGDEAVQPRDRRPLSAERAKVQHLGGATLTEALQAHPPSRRQRPLGRGRGDRPV